MRFIAALILFLSPLSALAQTPTLLEQFSDWEAYRYEGQDGNVTCYLLSKPKTLAPPDRNHGDVFFFLTTRPAEEVTHEASVLVGYPFAPDSNVVVDIDGQEFQLFTKDDGAWVESPADEAQLLVAMRAGSRMTVRGTSARGTETSYTFSLSGVTAGSNRIASGCDA
ncbi:invasion associated locus B family protein [Acuticoccus sp.]|uniref:invasion associated locus B family protein n=1 Tax=Acuticoccus sp. TaxID=1904378 RepID=UPI003B52771D